MSKIPGTILLLSTLFYFSLSFEKHEPEAHTTAKISKLLASRFGQTPRFRRKFLYNRVDLNNDGKKEILLGLLGSEFCDNSGCKLLILNENFAVIGSVSQVKYPVYFRHKFAKDVPPSFSNLFFYTHENDPIRINWSGEAIQDETGTSKFDLVKPLGVIHKALNVLDDPLYEF